VYLGRNAERYMRKLISHSINPQPVLQSQICIYSHGVDSEARYFFHWQCRRIALRMTLGRSSGESLPTADVATRITSALPSRDQSQYVRLLAVRCSSSM